ncbi:MAG TPA: hypothetical protein EYP60_03610 [bacterium (Candidatus Stahlbacteria)]|nr:hypothetical protein [Candidatus Stahlbacteria bacterium]
MEETGKVVGVDGELVRVEIEPKGACSHCAARAICNPAGNKMYTEAVNEKGARVGDTVRLEMNPRSTILAAFLIFILPIIAFGIGFAILKLITKTDSISVLAGIGFLAIYFIFLKRLDERISRGRKFKPIVTEIITKTL